VVHRALLLVLIRRASSNAELVVPSLDDVVSAARSVRDAGYAVDETGDNVRLADPWSTELRLRTDG